MNKTFAIIMGAAVLADGRASSAMRRRVEAALSLRDEFQDLIFIPSGGKVRNPLLSEAETMRKLLIEAGVNSEFILTETKAKHTIQNIINSAQIIKSYPAVGKAIVCSDSYHILRCRLLLYLLGISTIYRPMPGGRKTAGWMRWVRFCIREAAAIPMNVVMLLVLKFLRKV
jgi:uncharacterized SAM-binding protein YcdF (DUF218 family)